MRRQGKISPTRAARLLGVHVNTVYAWCRSAECGEPSRLSSVERDPENGYLYIELDEVLELRRRGREGEEVPS